MSSNNANSGMKFGIQIMPKKQLLDVQGRTVEHFLKEKSFPVQNLRIGKFIELEVLGKNESENRELVKKAMESGLFNSLTEQYEIVHSSAAQSQDLAVKK